jgi:hypothetical protein
MIIARERDLQTLAGAGVAYGCQSTRWKLR